MKGTIIIDLSGKSAPCKRKNGLEIVKKVKGSPNLQIKDKKHVPKSTINWSKLGSVHNINVIPLQNKQLPAVSYKFNRNELRAYREQIEQAQRNAEAERQRMQDRDARGRLQELTQTQRIDICYSFGVLKL